MRICVINLKKSSDRLAFQVQQLSHLDLEFTRVEAQTVGDFSSADYDATAFRWERPLSRIEYACYLSHRKVWQQVIDTNEPSLILEDDACLSDELPDFLSALERREGFDFITLEARGRKKVVGVRLLPVTNHISVQRLFLDRSGAAAYILWPSGARHLIDLERCRGVALADAQICRAFKMRAFQVSPALAVQADCARHYGISEPFVVTSTIWSGPRKLAPVESTYLRLRFKWNRVLSQLRMASRLILCLLPSVERTQPRVEMAQYQGVKNGAK